MRGLRARKWCEKNAPFVFSLFYYTISIVATPVPLPPSQPSTWFRVLQISTLECQSHGAHSSFSKDRSLSKITFLLVSCGSPLSTSSSRITKTL